MGSWKAGTIYIADVEKKVNGWQQNADGRWMYRESRTGKLVTGWQIVDGRNCWFDENGFLGEGGTLVEKTWYLFGSYEAGNPGLLTGYQTVKNKGYYANANGILQIGWQYVQQNGQAAWRYFSRDEENYGQEIETKDLGSYWYELNGKRYYFRNNKSLLKGWQTVEGKRYFFTIEGYAQTGWYPDSSSKNAYYLDAETGAMLTGYQEINGGHYYFHTNGVRLYGWQRISEYSNYYVWHYFEEDAKKETYGREISSSNIGDYWYEMRAEENGEIYRYYFPNNSGLAKGWRTINVDGVSGRYYFDNTGKMYVGTRKIGNAYYHFKEENSGRGSLGTGLFTDAGRTYYANGSGVLQRGWQKIEGTWRYFDPETGAECTDTRIGTDYWANVSNWDEDGQKVTYRYYFLNGTRAATGWQTIEGRRYYFDANGILQTGFFTVGVNTYYGAADTEAYPGAVVTGQQRIGEKEYYFGSNYVMMTGFQKIDGTWYYYSQKGTSPERGQRQELTAGKVEGSWFWYTVEGQKYCLKNDSSLLKGWQTINGNRYYLDPTTGAAVCGENRLISGYTYCFDADGVMQKNTVVYGADGIGYGYDANGRRVKGWQKLNNAWYYFDPNSWELVNYTRSGDYWITLNGTDTYYFRNNASMVKGWQTIDGKRYYFDAKTGVLQTGDERGIYTIGANSYYLGMDGVLHYGWIKDRENTYYANTSGILVSGWQRIENQWYYFEKISKKQDKTAGVGNDYFAHATEDGANHTYYFINGTSLAKNWQTIEGKRYYFDADGIMQTGFFNVGRTWYYYETDRSVKTGWWKNPQTGKSYYFNKNGQAVTGWQTIDGERYYFDADAVMQTQRTKIGNTWYFFGTDGKMRKGFVTYCGTTYYFNNNGQALRGWQTLNGQRYYFNTDGAMQTGFITIGTATYYFGESGDVRGQMQKGLQSIDGFEYYFNTNGVRQYGFQKVNGEWKFFDLQTGKGLKLTIAKNYWITLNLLDGITEKAYIKNAATVLKGWQNIDGKRYYFDNNGIMQTGWLTIGSTKYYLNEDGSVYQGFLTEGEGNKKTVYYLNANGQMLKGWQTIKVDNVSGRYYFDPTTGQAWLGHQKIGNYRYYFNPEENGKMATGFITVGEDCFTYNTSGVQLYGWQKIRMASGDVWYYFDAEDEDDVIGRGYRAEGGTAQNNWATITLKYFGERTAYIKNGTTVLRGWQTLNLGAGNKRYYFDNNGFLHTQKMGWLIIGKAWYYFDKDNSAYQGLLKMNEGGTDYLYYLNTNGQMLTGWQNVKVNGVIGRYYFNPSTGHALTGHQKIGNTWYYFNPVSEGDFEAGKMTVGYITDEQGEHYYYNTNGALLTGWQKLKGETDYRYFDANGDGNGNQIGIERTMTKTVQEVGKTAYHWYTMGGNRYCFVNNSSLLRNRQTIDGTYYWFHSSTGALYTGYFTIGQNWYHADADGKVHPGWGSSDGKTEDGNAYYNGYGQRITGWLSLKENNQTNKYYLNANGVRLKGVCWIGGTRYVFDPNDGRLVTDSVKIGDSVYYADGNGRLKTGWNRFAENGITLWRYLDTATGVYREAVKDSSHEDTAKYNWYQIKNSDGNTEIYCIYNNSTLLKNYQNVDGKRYYFDTATGVLKKGWFKSGTNLCYSDPDTGVITAGLQLNGRYYLNSNGVTLKGWQTVKVDGVNKKYYFRETGEKASGWITISGSRYCLINGGEAATGFIAMEGSAFYFNGSGVMQTGIQNVKTERGTFRYGFDRESGRLQKGEFTLNGVSYYSDPTTGIINTAGYLRKDASEGWHYYDGNGKLVTGWVTLKSGADAGKYYFAVDGTAATGMTKVGNNYYYFDKNTRILQKDAANLIHGTNEAGKEALYYTGRNEYLASGWQKVNGNWYYFDTETREGKAADVVSGRDGNWVEVNGATYYFRNGTSLVKGWQTIKVDGENGRYYFDGSTGALRKGWIDLGSSRYYTDPETGKAYTGLKSFEREDGHSVTYYFDGNGLMKTGWISVKGQDGVTKTYYFNTYGVMRKGLIWIGNTRYLLDSETGERQSGWQSADGNTYYLNGNGAVLTGWQTLKSKEGINGRYYLGTDGIMQTGLQEIAGKTYYFGTDGAMKTGFQTVNGKKYYFNGSGVMQTGWIRFTENRVYVWRFYDALGQEKNFREQSDSPKGENVSRYQWYTVDGSWYCIYNNASVLKGFQNIGTWRYYFDSVTGELETDGEFRTGNVVYYCEAGTGAINRSGLFRTDASTGDHYYYDGNGRRVTGWLNMAKGEHAGKYYFDTSTGKAVRGFGKVGNYYYYFDSTSGILQKNTSELIKGVNPDGKSVIYYTGKYEYLQSGWQKVNGSWYYFDTVTREGTAASTMENRYKNWVTIGEKIYYFRGGSTLAKSWQTIAVGGVNGRYYFDATTGELQSGWLYLGSSRYYTDPATGKAVSGLKELDGETYYFDANGLMKTGWITTKNEAGVSETRYFNAYGMMLKGLRWINGVRYTLDEESGVLIKNGMTIGNNTWYTNTSGALVGRIYTDEATGERYYYDANNKLVTGWVTVTGSTGTEKYYFDPENGGAACRGGWYDIKGTKYLFDIEGRLTANPEITSLASNNYRTATVKWKEIPAAKSYELQYSTDGTFEDTSKIVSKIYEGENLTVSAEIRELEPNVRYYFRVKYTLEAKNETNSIEIAWSPVKNIVIRDMVSPGGGSAAMDQFTVKTTTNSDGTEVTGLHIEFRVKGWLKSYDDQYYLQRVDSYSWAVRSKEPVYTFEKADGTEDGDYFRYSYDLPIPEEFAGDSNIKAEIVMSRYALYVKNGANSYGRISAAFYVTDPEDAADYQTPYFVADSKKGIQGAGKWYSRDMGTKQTLMNLDLKSVYLNDQSGRSGVKYTYKGKDYYFANMSGWQSTVREYNQGTYDGAGQVGQKISVTMVIVCSLRWDNRVKLIHPSARSGSSAKYYTLDSTSQGGQELYEALFSYLGECFGTDDCYVSNWVLGNEVNSCNAWNYAGSLNMYQYMQAYAASFRQLYYGVKSTRASSRVFISLDNAWNRAVAGYAGKPILDSFASYINTEGKNIQWNVAFHPYSQPLTRVDFWNDYSNTTDSIWSPHISMRNINQLCGYLSSMESTYKKEPGSIRLILSEQGWTSTAGESAQAEAILRGYYIAEFNDRVDAFIIRAEVDDSEEMSTGLYLGLRNQNDTKKTSYYAYKYMDSSVETFVNIDGYHVNVNNENKSKFRAAQSLVRSLTAGFSDDKMEKLENMRPAIPE